jgi:hypothetical protein
VFVLNRLKVLAQGSHRYGASHPPYLRPRRVPRAYPGSKRCSNCGEDNLFLYTKVHNKTKYCLSQTSWSPTKEHHVRMLIAFHLGNLYRGFQSGEYNENYIENVDETHFVINMENGKTLGLRGDQTVKYADVVSGGEAMTMVVRVTGEVRAKIMAPMIIFTNAGGAYPIRGVPNNMPGVTYQSSQRGWMSMDIFSQYFDDPIAYQGDRFNHRKQVWVDNSSTHNPSEQLQRVLHAKNTEVCYLSACSTSLCQPADQFIIAKIKDAWTRRRESKKTKLIREQQWQNDSNGRRGFSGKLKNPGKPYFLLLAAATVQDVNEEHDAYGMTYARKSMIRCGLSLDLDGVWKTEQLFPELQQIIVEH